MQTAETAQILTIDDDPVITRLVKLFLERTNRYTVTVENRATYAWKTARQIQPRLILLDLNMPGKDGSMIHDEIRSDEELCETPILFLSGLISTAEAARFSRKSPKTEVLVKPFSPQALLDRVDGMLAARA